MARTLGRSQTGSTNKRLTEFDFKEEEVKADRATAELVKCFSYKDEALSSISRTHVKKARCATCILPSLNGLRELYANKSENLKLGRRNDMGRGVADCEHREDLELGVCGVTMIETDLSHV